MMIIIKNGKKVESAKNTLISITPIHSKGIHNTLHFHIFKIFFILQYETYYFSQMPLKKKWQQQQTTLSLLQIPRAIYMQLLLSISP